MIIWFTGLSGSGKTTLAKYLYKRIKPLHKNTIYLDGDIIRKCFSMDNDSDYTYEKRRENAQSIHELSLILDRQKINVICAIQLIFNDIRSTNSKVYSLYKEIHVTCSMKTLKKRDTKNLYKLYNLKKAKNIVGIDIPYPKPKSYDFELNSDEDIKTTLSKVDLIFDQLAPNID